MSVIASRTVEVVFQVLSRLPLGLLQGMGACVGRLMHAYSAKFRREFERNLRGAIPEADEALIRSAAAHAGRAMLELPWVWMRPRERVLEAVVEVSGWEHVEALRTHGRGIVMLTPHMGAFEVAARLIGSRIPITVLYRAPRQPWLGPLMRRGRDGGGVSLAAADASGVRRLLRTLRDGGTVGILPDQVPANGEGVWADFFGRPAYTMTLAARLTSMAAGTLMVFAERLPRGQGFHLHFLPCEVAVTGDTAQRVDAINRNVEALVRRYPAQYIWGYKRYKRPPGVERPAR
jgi:Kdo2-lipid IVA lauroyltransferase/acyltransferase